MHEKRRKFINELDKLMEAHKEMLNIWETLTEEDSLKSILDNPNHYPYDSDFYELFFKLGDWKKELEDRYK